MGGNPGRRARVRAPSRGRLILHNLNVAIPDPLLRELDSIVRQAGRLAQTSRQDLARELKPDGSVVTNGDRSVESFLRPELERLRPGAPVWGEEFGFAEEGPDGLWTVDPIDGTTNYAFGSPLWGVTVGLVVGEAVEMGAVYLPDLDEMYLAARGQGAWCNGDAMPSIPPGSIANHEIVSYCDTVLKRYPGQKWPGKMRCTGSFVVEGAFVARQRYRGMVGIREKLYDVAGAVCLCAELGAEIRYASGRAFSIAELKPNVPIPEAWVIFPAETEFELG